MLLLLFTLGHAVPVVPIRFVDFSWYLNLGCQCFVSLSVNSVICGFVKKSSKNKYAGLVGVINLDFTIST